MFHRTPPRPLRPIEGNTVGLSTRFSGRYPIDISFPRARFSELGSLLSPPPDRRDCAGAFLGLDFLGVLKTSPKPQWQTSRSDQQGRLGSSDNGFWTGCVRALTGVACWCQ